jgi:hypothetical protein
MALPAARAPRRTVAHAERMLADVADRGDSHAARWLGGFRGAQSAEAGEEDEILHSANSGATSTA